MLLAAGHGARMEPLSTWIAKPALEVLGQPLLASSLSALARAGVPRLVANLHRHAAQVARAVRAARPNGAALRLSFEPVLLGGAGGLGHARARLGPGAVLAANADVWSDLDLAPLLAAARDDAAVLAVMPHPDPARWASLVLADDGRVERFAAPGSCLAEAWLFTGFQVIGGAVMASLPDAHAELAPVWQALRSSRRLFAVPVEGVWREVGTPAAYRGLIGELLGGSSWVHRTADVGPSAALTRSAIGAGCRVGAEAHLYGSIVTGGASVGRGAHLINCVVAGPVAVPDRGEVRSSLIVPGLTVPLPSSR